MVLLMSYSSTALSNISTTSGPESVMEVSVKLNEPSIYKVVSSGDTPDSSSAVILI